MRFDQWLRHVSALVNTLQSTWKRRMRKWRCVVTLGSGSGQSGHLWAADEGLVFTGEWLRAGFSDTDTEVNSPHSAAANVKADKERQMAKGKCRKISELCSSAVSKKSGRGWSFFTSHIMHTKRRKELCQILIGFLKKIAVAFVFLSCTESRTVTSEVC